jgi:putative SOS response-associated peptidase YedK
MSLSAADHRTAAIMLSDAVPGFEPDGLASWLERAEYRPHTNIGPGQPHFIVRGRSGRAILDRGLWGFTGANKPNKLIFNARAETIDTRPMFRAAFEHRRCLVPADGFFEWERSEDRRLPWWFHREDHRLLLFAGVFDPPQRDDARARFSIITVPAAGVIARIHDRMPAILGSDDVSHWLGDPPSRVLALLRPRPEQLGSFRVSTRFNAVGHEGAIEPDVS